VTTRLYAGIVSSELGQPIRIENKASEAGATAAAAVKNAAPDGYTLLVFSGAQLAAIPAMQRVGYEPLKDFAPVTTLFTMVNLLAVPNGSPARSVAELMRLGREKSGGLAFGSSGVGTTSHLTAGLMTLSTGTPIKPLHYAGAAPMIADLVAGRLDFALVSSTVAMPYVMQGKLRLLAVDAAGRWPDLPGIPTLRQAGIDQPKVASWFALAAPAGTPESVISRLYDAFAAAARDPRLLQGLRDNGAELTLTTPEETASIMADESRKTAALVRALNLGP
jgi:tripartite-type tricarboxylate transporter receptor subunit TctC